MQTVIANRADFFPKDGCPIALRTIQGDQPSQHEGDLTDIRHTHDFSELIIITAGGGEHEAQFAGKSISFHENLRG